MSRSPRPLCWAVLAACLCAGCGKKGPNPDDPGPAPPVAAHVGPPLTDEDYREFGRKLEKAVAEGDTAELGRLIRVMDLFERSISDLDLSASMRKGVMAGASQQSGQFAGQIAEVVKNGGSYTLVRVRTVDGRKKALFRLLFSEGGVNYHEYTLARYPDGLVGTEDLYIYLAGEPITQTFRRTLLGLLAGQDRGLVGRLSGPDQAMAKNVKVLIGMTTDIRNGRFKEGLAAFRKLPPELQKNKVFQIFAIQAAQGTGDDAEYLAAMERFRRDHPDDPAAELMSIDYFTLKKQYDEVLKAVDRLDRAVGGDPYLDVLRSSALAEAGRFRDAAAAAEKSVKGNPKLPLAYWTRVSVALKEKNHKDTLAWLKKGVEAGVIRIDLDNIRTSAEYAVFAKSPEFKELTAWLAKREK